MNRGETAYQVLARQAEHAPDAPAILAPGRPPLNYRALCHHVRQVVTWMNALGIGRGDRVAIVLPNGPEMATAFLGVASGATSAPLNPAYRAGEFDFYLSDLNARALILQSGLDSPAREVARARGLHVIEISPRPERAAGIFSLAAGPQGAAAAATFAQPDDAALILHTSGTTSRPKIVPLTQRNICTSADHTRTTLRLTDRDRCLNVMPLFHIHGLMAAILASLAAGASVACTPGFQPDEFFGWLQAFQPTWYTAVPTMHQAILARVAAHRDVLAGCSLRFIRSSSASLPPRVMKALEAAFDAPVIEAYGMTEAAHQMASNPLPPMPRRPGTVGVAAGPEVGITNEEGAFLPPGQPGEIVIRGENVTPGYENNPSANERAFAGGWFHTGDQGVMDADGYLTITGRLKEIVNRAGEKIAPREVDEALLDHPAVAQAVAFGTPHPTLGEDLAAAVVLHDGSSATEPELRRFAFARLADYKVPSQIVVVDEIPKGATGKVQRIGLAARLAPRLRADYISPRTPLEEALAAIWAATLGVERVGVRDNFFALGGDSLSAVSLAVATEKLVNRPLQPALVFRAPTIEQLASLVHGDPDPAGEHSSLVPLQPGGTTAPIFLVPGHGGDVFTFVELARQLQPGRPVYTFRFPEAARQNDEVASAMLREMAARYVTEMRALQPDGPYLLGGFCYGGEVAFEMARQLGAQGQAAGLVAIISAYLQGSVRLAGFGRRAAYHLKKTFEGSARQGVAYVAKRVTNVIERASRRHMPAMARRLAQAPRDQEPGPAYYPGRITLFRPADAADDLYRDPLMGWSGLAADIEIYEVPGNRATIFTEPNVQVLAEQLKQCMGRSGQGPDKT